MSDVDQLRQAHPRWDIGTQWTAVATGPDYCNYTASREGITLRASTARELDRLISAVEVANGWPCRLDGQPVPNI